MELYLLTSLNSVMARFPHAIAYNSISFIVGIPVFALYDGRFHNFTYPYYSQHTFRLFPIITIINIVIYYNMNIIFSFPLQFMTRY